MKRKEIYFNKGTFEYQLGQLKKITELANSFNAGNKFYNLTLEDVKMIIYSKEKFLK